VAERTETPEGDIPPVAGIERRSIDYIPAAERYGRPLNQFTLWFGANLQITAVVTGALAVVLGGDVVWSIVGLLIGQIAGGAVMALHSVQGPKLGLPQMIQSRAQFGVYGAVIPLVLVIVMYIGFFASGTVLAGQAVAGLGHFGTDTGILIFGALTAVIAAIGYRLIHIMGRITSVICALAFLYLGIRLFTSAHAAALLGDDHFDIGKFLLAISLSASWQIAYGPYVADYSRYLPATTPGRVTFWSTLAGSGLGSQWSMTFGVFAAAAAGDEFGKNEVAYVVKLGGAGLVAALLYLVIALGKLTVNVLNTYGGFMSMVTTVTGFRGDRTLSRGGRVAYIAAIMVAGTGIALLGQGDFLASFSSFLLFLLTLFTPWSAINLVDFYFISRERYDVPALFDPDGRYGRWRVKAIAVYVIGVAAQLPFLDTSFFTGPMVARLGGTDVSWIIGLVVPSVLYYLLARGDRGTAPDHTILPDTTEAG
jgi:NCS1 family nucleobase:cation symporter-1